MAAYWQVAFLQHPVLWDSIDVSYPWRFFIGECLHNGILPLWNPYSKYGYPFFSDLQSGAWYPIALLTGASTRYSLYIFQLEHIFTLLVGAVGMYRLARSFVLSHGISFFTAICFVASGFFVSNAEHTTLVVSAAWTAWLFWAYVRMLQTMKYGYALLAALFIAMMFTGGYPAILVVAGYIMLAISVGMVISAGAHGERLHFLKLHALLAGCIMLLIAGFAWHDAEAISHVTRGDGITAAKANEHSFSMQSLLSCLLPFASIKNDLFFKTDIAMRNAYFGIISLALALTGLLLPGSRKQWPVIIIAIVCLCVSFGAQTPLRKWLYDYVPLMNLFRFPSIFRLFFIMGAIIMAAHTLQQLTGAGANYLNRFRVVVVTLIAIFLFLIAYEYHKYGSAGNYKLLFTDINAFIQQSLFYQHVIIQSLLQLAILGILLFVIQFRKAKYFTVRVVLCLCAFDLFTATQLNAYGTIVSTLSTKTINDKVMAQDVAFPIPDIHRPMGLNNDNLYKQEFALQSNLCIFKKQPAIDGYNPFTLKNYELLDESRIKDSVWANPYVYFSYGVALQDTGILPSRNIASVTADVLARTNNIHLEAGAGDSVSISSFKPGNIVLQTFTEHNAILVLQQADYKGWVAYIDGQPAEHFVTNLANSSILVPPGTHTILFRFQPAYIVPIAILSLISFVSMIIVLVVFRKRLL